MGKRKYCCFETLQSYKYCLGYILCSLSCFSALCPAGGRLHTVAVTTNTPPDSIVDTYLVSHQTTHSSPHFHFMNEGTKLQTKLVDFAFRVYSCLKAMG